MADFYEIRVEGHLNSEWAEWFENFTLHKEENGQTVLRGPLVDQAALHGLIARIRNLALPLVAVNRLDNVKAGSSLKGDEKCNHQ